jgi:hypothetical protein
MRWNVGNIGEVIVRKLRLFAKFEASG